MKILDTIAFSDTTFALRLAKPKYRNRQQLNFSELTVPYPYFSEDNVVNMHSDVYVIPYIEKYFHNMMEIWTNILYLKKNNIEFTLVVVCDNPEDYNKEKRIPYGWENTGDNNMYCFKKLLDQNKVKYICFAKNSKEYVEMCPRAGYIFFDRSSVLSNDYLNKNYPRELYYKSFSPHEPCVAQMGEAFFHRIDMLLEWGPKYKMKNNKIYITRKNYPDRQLKREEFIIDYLKSVGYDIIYFEKYSVEEQIKIVQEASNIVVQSGSSLLNCLFMNDKAKIFEIETAEYDVSAYEFSFKKRKIEWTRKRYNIADGNYIVEKLKKDEYFQNAFVAQRTEQDSSKVLVAGSTPAEGAK